MTDLKQGTLSGFELRVWDMFRLMFSFIFFTALLTIISTGEAMATEEAKYTVIDKHEHFETRLYESHIVAETVVKSEFEDAGSEAFKRLFDYITGENISQQKIEMTAPVSQGLSQQTSDSKNSEKIEMTSPVGQRNDNGSWVVSFMMPASYTYETLPQPKDASITLRQVPAQYIASIEYSGFWSEKNYLSNKQKLQSWINKQGYSVVGEPVWARYNAPFTPWFLRRNEILIPIKNPVTTK